MWAAIALILLAVAGLAINLYFLSLTYSLPAGLSRLLAGLMRTCGVRSASCRRVVETRYARLFPGLPNPVIGTLWCLLLLAQCGLFLATGSFPLWEVAVAISFASVGIAVYLTAVLFFVLRDPCPL
ncbi:MAG: vitamin K epoxide reductase family protein [Planctomycetota bacterium]|jgi:uncharacterized membrane protein